MVEKERLLQFADALRNKLQYFDELERVSAQFHSAALAVDSDSFLPLLERLDDCITSVAAITALLIHPLMCTSHTFLTSIKCMLAHQHKVHAGPNMSQLHPHMSVLTDASTLSGAV